MVDIWNRLKSVSDPIATIGAMKRKLRLNILDKIRVEYKIKMTKVLGHTYSTEAKSLLVWFRCW
jgi:hypothetical protein